MPLLSEKERNAYLILCAYAGYQNYAQLPDHIKSLSTSELIDLSSALKKVENALLKIVEHTVIKVRECMMYKPGCIENILKNDMKRPLELFRDIALKVAPVYGEETGETIDVEEEEEVGPESVEDIPFTKEDVSNTVKIFLAQLVGGRAISKLSDIKWLLRDRKDDVIRLSVDAALIRDPKTLSKVFGLKEGEGLSRKTSYRDPKTNIIKELNKSLIGVVSENIDWTTFRSALQSDIQDIETREDILNLWKGKLSDDAAKVLLQDIGRGILERIGKNELEDLKKRVLSGLRFEHHPFSVDDMKRMIKESENDADFPNKLTEFLKKRDVDDVFKAFSFTSHAQQEIKTFLMNDMLPKINRVIDDDFKKLTKAISTKKRSSSSSSRGSSSKRSLSRKGIVSVTVGNLFSLFSLDEIEDLHLNPDNLFHYMITPAKNSKLAKRMNDKSKRRVYVELYKTIRENVKTHLRTKDTIISVSTIKKELSDRYQTVEGFIKT